MYNNYLFIDTEASGLPRNWKLPFSAEDNWPHAVQVSWIVYDKDQNLVKLENHYIKTEGVTISASAIKIHGITPEFLATHGEERNKVMKLLATDLLHYQPLVIGHFIRLDYYIISAGFHRSNINNPLGNLPVFCTMVATKRLAWNPMPRHLRLEELYAALFYTSFTDQHDALKDAQITAECFFELVGRGDITDKNIQQQIT